MLAVACTPFQLLYFPRGWKTIFFIFVGALAISTPIGARALPGVFSVAGRKMRRGTSFGKIEGNPVFDGKDWEAHFDNKTLVNLCEYNVISIQAASRNIENFCPWVPFRTTDALVALLPCSCDCRYV